MFVEMFYRFTLIFSCIFFFHAASVCDVVVGFYIQLEKVCSSTHLCI